MIFGLGDSKGPGAIPDRVSMLSQILDATNTDLSQFRKAGGKLLISQGLAVMTGRWQLQHGRADRCTSYALTR
jgi:hypothetical protein